MQVGYISGKVGEILDKVGVGGGELGGGEGGCEGTDAEVAGEGGASRFEKDEDITIYGISGGLLIQSGRDEGTFGTE